MNANLDNQRARRRANLSMEWSLQMPRGVTFDPAKDRIIIADTQRGRLQIYDKPKNYMEPQLDVWKCGAVCARCRHRRRSQTSRHIVRRQCSEGARSRLGGVVLSSTEILPVNRRGCCKFRA